MGQHPSWLHYTVQYVQSALKPFNGTCTVSHDNQNHYATSVGAVLEQMATSGGKAHFEEQIASVSVSSLTYVSFVNMEHTLGTYLQSLDKEQLLNARSKKTNQFAISNKSFDGKVPAITVVVDDGWSKHAHKHSYNAKSGVTAIFGAATKKSLFIGIQNKHYSVCTVSEHKKLLPPEGRCFKNWLGLPCSMELAL